MQMRSRTVTTFLAITLVLSGVCHANRPVLQDRIIQASSIAANSPEANAINAYVRFWADRMGTDDDQVVAARVAESRRELTAPFGRGPSSAFRTTYEAALSERLLPLAQSPQMLVRLNTMVITAQMRSQAIFPLIEAGMSDELPAVRYWAARAGNLLVQSGKASESDLRTRLDPEMQQRVLGIFGPKIATEVVGPVFQQMALAVGSLDSNEADNRMLDALNARIGLYATNPRIGPAGVRDAINQLSNKRFTTPDRMDSNFRRKMMIVCYRYIRLYHLLQSGGYIPEAEDLAWREAAGRAHDALVAWVGTISGVTDIPAVFRDTPDQRDISLFMFRWLDLLRDQLNIPANELEVRISE
ncbi:MAG: hypothetical protein JJU36_16580 [Phycisphaeraceae bacterium]|nr:hypothetical protein [Phycisphaeraceae bacterium]